MRPGLPRARAGQVLEAATWSLQRAVAIYYTQQEEVQQSRLEVHDPKLEVQERPVEQERLGEINEVSKKKVEVSKILKLKKVGLAASRNLPNQRSGESGTPLAPPKARLGAGVGRKLWEFRKMVEGTRWNMEGTKVKNVKLNPVELLNAQARIAGRVAGPSQPAHLAPAVQAHRAPGLHPGEGRALRPVVVDGTNVAMLHGRHTNFSTRGGPGQWKALSENIS